jgi:hypothetical protein
MDLIRSTNCVRDTDSVTDSMRRPLVHVSRERFSGSTPEARHAVNSNCVQLPAASTTRRNRLLFQHVERRFFTDIWAMLGFPTKVCVFSGETSI